MNIALLGYGKMGKAIEKIALDRGHKVVLKLDESAKSIDFNQAEVAFDFSIPEAAYNNICQALESSIPVLSGTTGWLERYDEVVDLCHNMKGSFLYASNFSIGVNLFFQLNAYLAELIQPYQYDVEIDETHHIQKLDAPSGTAITLAEQVLPFTAYKTWQLQGESKENEADLLPITSYREGQVTGTHEVVYHSSIDDISIKHKANNRTGFALGAVLAAEYIVDKTGVFTMKDVLKLDKNTLK